jgi:hypothetical protein
VVVRPVVDPYLPAEQLMHEVLPDEEYFPVVQGAVHADVVSPCVDPYLPAPQLVHDPALPVEY